MSPAEACHADMMSHTSSSGHRGYGGHSRRQFKPHHSQSVPRSEDLGRKSEVQHEAVPITTLMLRNIPNKYTQAKLLLEIDECGFVGTYDFFYLPMDVHNRSNVGYAFINFVDPEDATKFQERFAQHRFCRFQGRKVSSVCVAHVQGLYRNLRHFENRAVTFAKNDQYRPIVIRHGFRMDIDQALAEMALEAERTRICSSASSVPESDHSFQDDTTYGSLSRNVSADTASDAAQTSSLSRQLSPDALPFVLPEVSLSLPLALEPLYLPRTADSPASSTGLGDPAYIELVPCDPMNKTISGRSGSLSAMDNFTVAISLGGRRLTGDCTP
eukprot:TRINITY_DN101481_c0_g1_i1.p1 TRINITY_DN101481_c0_g1~~TRINITY_DN101481_c0_g1_i1.p1  ORF type:complete len:356 (+),score=53.98 TRINITY_DN101481_c0_g1_i1:87-1070(+)